jgi:hypothetical protein
LTQPSKATWRAGCMIYLQSISSLRKVNDKCFLGSLKPAVSQYSEERQVPGLLLCLATSTAVAIFKAVASRLSLTKPTNLGNACLDRTAIEEPHREEVAKNTEYYTSCGVFTGCWGVRGSKRAILQIHDCSNVATFKNHMIPTFVAANCCKNRT